MKKLEVALIVLLLMCAVPPATQVDWTIPVASLVTLLFAVGLHFGMIVGRVASERRKT